jgi:acyl-CoA thioesterase-1
LFVFCLWATFLTAAESKPAKKPAARPRANPAMEPVTDVAGLPRVLLIGDSISIGYTVPVRALLQGKANLHRPPTNCGPTTRGLEQIDRWLGDDRWDVIHFNWGLHDLKYVPATGDKLTDPKTPGSRPQVPREQYEANLRKLVARMQKTGATLIWAATTPVPPGAQGRIAGDEVAYNAIAEKIVREHHLATDDLYAFAKPRLKELQLPANVHFSKEGSQQLAAQVVQTIEQALANRKTDRK